MKKITFILFLALSSSLLTPCKAQYVDLYNFVDSTGAEPFGSLTLFNGLLYGTAYLGGANDSGCIFSVDTLGNNYKDIFDFNGANGKQPNSPLTVIGSLLYGTANGGGAHDSGCIFSVDTNGSGYRDLYDFSGPDGKNPYNALLFSNNVLFGVADGGAHNLGCVFSIDSNGTGYKKLLDFNITNGEYPLGIILVGTKLFGTTLIGGAHSLGTIYTVDTTGNNYKDLFDFNSTSGGGYEPYGGLTYAGGQLFGATAYGGASGYGALFSQDTIGLYHKRLFSFSGTNGAQPEYAGGSPTIIGNVFYGTTYYGGAHDSGVVFAIDTMGYGYTDLYDFTGPAGADPEGSLTLSGNNLYGATALGGTNHVGVVFSFNKSNVTTSIEKLTVGGGQLSVYPNPNSGLFTISCHPPAGGSQPIVEIYNVLGEKVYFGMLNPPAGGQHDEQIDLSSQPNGVYLYRVLNQDGSLLGTGKVLIQK